MLTEFDCAANAPFSCLSSLVLPYNADRVVVHHIVPFLLNLFYRRDADRVVVFHRRCTSLLAEIGAQASLVSATGANAFAA